MNEMDTAPETLQPEPASEPAGPAYGDGGFEDMDYGEIHETMNEMAEALGYENPNIFFQDLPDGVGGFNALQYETDADGNVVITSNSFVFNGQKLPDSAQATDRFPPMDLDDADGRFEHYEDPLDLLHTFYHEVATHGRQYRDIRNAETPWAEDELEDAMLMHEGMAAYNTDTVSYQDAQTVYEDFLTLVYDGEQDPDEALESLDQMYEMAKVELTDEAGNEMYDFIAVDRFEVAEYLGEAADPDDVDAAVETVLEERLGMLEATGYQVADIDAIDYTALDTEKIGDHLVRIQDALLDGFETMREKPEYGEEMLPRGYANVEDLSTYGVGGNEDGFETQEGLESVQEPGSGIHAGTRQEPAR